MGSSESKPWRETDIISWNEVDKDKLKDQVMKYRKNKINILLFGRQGQGKSAFVNTVFSALHGEHKTFAPESLGCDSITQGIKKYPLKDSDGTNAWDVSLSDMEGLKREDEDKIKNDLEHILKKGDFPPKDSTPLGDETPVHAMVVCNMFQDFNFFDDEIKVYVEHASRKGIPVFLLITKIDTAYTKDFRIQNIFSDRNLLTSTKEAAKKFGIPEKFVLLQHNYHGVNHLRNKTDIDILTLYNLRFILSNIPK